MSAVELLTKECTTCGGSFPLSAFYAHPTGRHGVGSTCRDCASEYNKKRKERFIEEHGEDAWREYVRKNVRAHRERHAGNRTSERVSREAYRAAESALRRAHPEEFDALLRKERYDRGLEV